MKCKKLTIPNHYRSGKPLIVLGRIKHDSNTNFIFITGSGKEYDISKSCMYILENTSQEFIETKEKIQFTINKNIV